MTVRKSTTQLPGAAACGVKKTGVKLVVEHVDAVAGGKHQGLGEKHSIPPADKKEGSAAASDPGFTIEAQTQTSPDRSGPARRSLCRAYTKTDAQRPKNNTFIFRGKKLRKHPKF